MESDGTPALLTGIILAGGQSTRFGADKASALLAGRPMLQWVVAALSDVCSEIIVVAAPGQSLPPCDSPVPIVVTQDEAPGLGPLAGLATGLRAARNELCFATSCDAPLLKPPLVRLLASLPDGFDVVCPDVGGRMQPLVAVYRTATCRPVFEYHVGAGSLKLTDAFTQLRVRPVAESELAVADPSLESFINANQPEVLRQIEARLTAPGP